MQNTNPRDIWRPYSDSSLLEDVPPVLERVADSLYTYSVVTDGVTRITISDAAVTLMQFKHSIWYEPDFTSGSYSNGEQYWSSARPNIRVFNDDCVPDLQFATMATENWGEYIIGSGP